MNETAGATERFLKQLAAGLEALGPHETGEVLAEIRGHLAEATEEAGGSDTDVLARFGSPEALATRILEERGVLSAGMVVRGAPLWMRLVAFTTDVALWVLVCMLVLLVNDGTGSHLLPFAGEFSYFHFFSLWTWLLVAAAVAAWWWIKNRRRRARATPPA